MEKYVLNQKIKLKENNSFIYLNHSPSVLKLSSSPLLISNIAKKINNINIKKNNNDKNNLIKKTNINFNLNLINKNNINQKQIRTITPNLKLREIVNKKIRENDFHNLKYNKGKIDLPDINQNKSYLHTDLNAQKKENDNMDRQLKLIFIMKNKINELNKIIKEKNQEINNLKNGELIHSVTQLREKTGNNHLLSKKTNDNYEIKKESKNLSKSMNNINTIKNENNRFKKIKKDYKESHKDNSKDNNKDRDNGGKKINSINSITKKYNEIITNNNKEILNLRKIITELEEKYLQEKNKNKEINQKYTFMRNCTFGTNSPQNKYDEKIRELQNKIIILEEQIYQYKIKEKQQKEKNTKNELKIIRNTNKNEKLILSDKEYSNIQICLNSLIEKFNLSEGKIKEGIKELAYYNIDKISSHICGLLKLSNNYLISNFINDYFIKNAKILNSTPFKELIKFKASKDDFINDSLNSFIKERSIIYDYKKKGRISIYYLRHLYNEFCFKNNKKENEKEFFKIVYTCKKDNYSSRLFDIFYDNLIVNDNLNAQDEKVIRNFVDSIFDLEMQKYKINK